MINAEELKRELLSQKITIPRFRFCNARAEDIEQLLTIAYMCEVERRQKTYSENDKTKAYIRRLAEITTAEKPKFGIMFAGPCGNGKTTMIYALQDAINYVKRRDGFRDIENAAWKVGMMITDARNVVEAYKEQQTERNKKFDSLKTQSMLCIEDMGKEPAETMTYGNLITPVTELLEYRYEKQLYTAITTNLTPAQIREKYGTRIADRCNEMLDVIVFENDSYRSKI